MSRIKITMWLNVEDEETDPDHEGGMTEDAFQTYIVPLAIEGFEEIETRLDHRAPPTDGTAHAARSYRFPMPKGQL